MHPWQILIEVEVGATEAVLAAEVIVAEVAVDLVAAVSNAKCTRLPVPTAAKTVKFPLGPQAKNQFFVMIVLEKIPGILNPAAEVATTVMSDHVRQSSPITSSSLIPSIKSWQKLWID